MFTCQLHSVIVQRLKLCHLLYGRVVCIALERNEGLDTNSAGDQDAALPLPTAAVRRPFAADTCYCTAVEMVAVGAGVMTVLPSAVTSRIFRMMAPSRWDLLVRGEINLDSCQRVFVMSSLFSFSCCPPLGTVRVQGRSCKYGSSTSPSVSSSKYSSI